MNRELKNQQFSISPFEETRFEKKIFKWKHRLTREIRNIITFLINILMVIFGMYTNYFPPVEPKSDRYPIRYCINVLNGT